MGTNYYWHIGYETRPRHIGKSSAGWCFLLHVSPDDGIHDLADWEALWAKVNGTILDEYTRSVTVAEMRSIITERLWDGRDEKPPGWYAQNFAAPGPNGLARAMYRSLGPGAGTWDRITGEFS